MLKKLTRTMQNSSTTAPSVILLAAGRGSRMQALSGDLPKCMLEVGGQRVLDWILDALVARGAGDLIVVTGYGQERVQAAIAQRHGSRVVCVSNARYQDDVNILSVDLGVAALPHPERGYLVVETDLLLDDGAWDRLFLGVAEGYSFWACHGVYSSALTGGIVQAGADLAISAVDYQPIYDSRYDGWLKMVGLLYVGPGEVAAHRRLSHDMVAENIARYYMVPWVQAIEALPCRALPLDGCFVSSFNTADEFLRARDGFLSGTDAGTGSQINS